MSEIAEVVHGSECPCPRCRGFEPGNKYAVGNRGLMRHGAYSVLRLSERSGEIEKELATELPSAPSPLRSGLAFVLARLEAADAALSADEQAGGGDEHERLRHDARSWSRTLLQYGSALGLSVEKGSGSSVTVNTQVLVASSEWQSTKQRIVEALAPFPEAQAAVRLALEAGS